MNVEHIQQIFSHYIEKFALLNNNEHDENFNWYITGGFHRLMDEALSAGTSEFPDALLRACKFTQNIIDSYMQPFYGLVEFARKELETVRQMFTDLYGSDITEERVYRCFRLPGERYWYRKRTSTLLQC